VFYTLLLHVFYTIFQYLVGEGLEFCGDSNLGLADLIRQILAVHEADLPEVKLASFQYKDEDLVIILAYRRVVTELQHVLPELNE